MLLLCFVSVISVGISEKKAGLRHTFGEIMMTTQLQKDADDEYFDDPIKLFDFESERVHFGLQSDVALVNTRHSHQNNKFSSDSEGIEYLDIPQDNFDKNDCHPLFIKLVDFRKFPWYFKKCNTVLNYVEYCDLVSDSEDDVVLVLDEINNSDTSLIYDPKERKRKKKYAIEYASKPLYKTVSETDLKTKQEITNSIEDFELQRALSQRNISQVDFKRNKGLIGLTIKQKVINNKAPNTKSGEVKNAVIKKIDGEIIDFKPPQAGNSRKTLIVNCTIQEKQVVNKEYTKNSKMLNNDDVYKKSVEQIKIENLENQANNSLSNDLNKHLEPKTLDPIINLSLDLSTSSNQETKNSEHGIMKIKKHEDTKMRVLSTSNCCENKLDKDNLKKVKNDIVITQDTYETVQNKRAVHSPILTCSSKKSITILTECALKEPREKLCDSLISKTKTIDEVVNESKKGSTFSKDKNSDECFNHDDLKKTNIPSQHITKNINSDDLSVISVAVECCTAKNNDNYIKDLPKNLPSMNSIQSTSSTYKTEDITRTIPPMASDTYSSDNSDALSIKIVSVQSIANSSEMTNKKQGSANLHNNSSCIRDSPCKPIATAYRSTPSVNTLKLNRNETSNDLNISHSINKIISHNTHASAIILKPKQQSTSLNRFLLNPPVVSNHETVQCTPQYRYSTHSNFFNNFKPHQVKTTNINYQTRSPYVKYKNSIQNNAIQYQSNNNRWSKPNIFPNKLPRYAWYDNIHPYQVQLPATENTIISQINNHNEGKGVFKSDDFQKKSIPAYNSTIGSDICISKRNSNIDPRIVRENNNGALNEFNGINCSMTSETNNDLVTSKKEMLKVLDGLRSYSASGSHKIYSKEQKNVQPVKPIRRPTCSINTGGFNQILKQNGYSPPILPIPTYEVFMGQVKLDCQKSSGLNNNTMNNENLHRKPNKRNKRKYNESSQELIKDAKRISLEEYKNRTAVNVRRSIE